MRAWFLMCGNINYPGQRTVTAFLDVRTGTVDPLWRDVMFAFSVLGISVAAVFVFYIEVTLQRHFQLMVSNRFARTWIYQLGKVMNGA